MKEFLITALGSFLVACASQPSADEGSGIEYSSVQEALESLQQKPGTQMSNRGGWILIRDDQAQTMWSFAPDNHPAHPAVAKVSLIVKDGRAIANLRIKCEASKEQCDAFAKDMQARTGNATDKTRQQLQGSGQ